MNIEQVLSSACPKLDIDKNRRLLFFHFKFLIVEVLDLGRLSLLLALSVYLVLNLIL